MFSHFRICVVKTATRSSTSSHSPSRLTGPGSNRRFSFVNETQKAILLGDVGFDGFDNQLRIKVNVLLKRQSASEREIPTCTTVPPRVLLNILLACEGLTCSKTSRSARCWRVQLRRTFSRSNLLKIINEESDDQQTALTRRHSVPNPSKPAAWSCARPESDS